MPAKRKHVSIISPLRYPGAKKRLAKYVAECIRVNGLKPKVLVEPFAGGASVSLQLLNDGLVEKVALGEKDPIVAAFWEAVFWDTDWLVDQIETIEVSLENWHRFKKIGADASPREKALACIFLNRTSFSGIIAASAGPIGGYGQQSQYKIDCRFTVSTLVKRIRQAAALRDRVIFVNNADWTDTLQKASELGLKTTELLVYLDPPFYNKAEKLYRFFFTSEEHVALRNSLAKLRSPWILSYDVAPEIEHLYKRKNPSRVDLLYSASGTNPQVESRELIISNLRRVPSENRLWSQTKKPLLHTSRSNDQDIRRDSCADDVASLDVASLSLVGS